MAAIPVTKDRTPSGAPNHTFSDTDLRYEELLSEGYPHSKLLSLSYKGKGNNFLAKSKVSLDLKGAHYSKPSPKTSSQVKLITNVQGRDVEAKFDNRGNMRLWANLGTYDFGKIAILTGKVKTDSQFKSLSYAAGLDWSHGSADLSARIHIKDGGHPFLNQKVHYTKDNVRVGSIYKLSLATFLFSRLNWFAIYRQNDYRLYFQHSLQGKGIAEFASAGKTTLAATYKHKRAEYVLKASHRADKPKDRFRFVFGTVAKLDDNSVVRAKINNNTKLTLSWKRDFTKNFTLSVGTQVTLSDPSSFSTSKVIPIPVGFSLNFSQK